MLLRFEKTDTITVLPAAPEALQPTKEVTASTRRVCFNVMKMLSV
jgi:hypothetical protein